MVLLTLHISIHYLSCSFYYIWHYWLLFSWKSKKYIHSFHSQDTIASSSHLLAIPVQPSLYVSYSVFPIFWCCHRVLFQALYHSFCFWLYTHFCLLQKCTLTMTIVTQKALFSNEIVLVSFTPSTGFHLAQVPRYSNLKLKISFSFWSTWVLYLSWYYYPLMCPSQKLGHYSSFS